MALFWTDLVGKPWREPGASEPVDGMDCLDAGLTVQERLGRTLPARDGDTREQRLWAWAGCQDSPWRQVAVDLAAANQVGDMVLQHGRVYALVDERDRLFLTSLHGRGVCAVKARFIEGPLTVWRWFGP